MKRRDFMTAAAAGGAGIALAGTARAAGSDLVLKNVNALIDGSFIRRDLGIAAGVITDVAEPNTLSGAKVVDCGGLHASPGWVDLHVHYVTPSHRKFIGTSVKRLGTVLGVTALTDAGTTGPGNFNRLVASAADDPDLTCKAFIYITSDGIEVSDYLYYKTGWDDIEGIGRAIEKYGDRIVGIKFRADHSVTPKDDRTYYVRKCREASDRYGLPSMIHIGAPPPSITDILAILKEGDIITHCLRHNNNSVISEDGKLLDSVKDAKERGVRFDVGHGVGSFTFDTAQRALDQGFDDFTISSDLYLLSVLPGKVKTYANVLTQFLALGMSPEWIMDRASTRPAEVAGLERVIKKGAEASITLFSIANGDFNCVDVKGNKKISDKRIIPEWTIVKGKMTEAGHFDKKLFL